ncbi:hypothetical protein UCDDS831_g05215 [Diplodia seriata]|uniref:Uncharacterized protein n=1 Tax=Diplodia seriata TaxID=420778 RepID=A0A0G2EB73_9PEZI|nr:hypothetical protein UCDDS831_g05215 [Diplodia seriata]
MPELSPGRLLGFMDLLEEARDQQEDHHERREEALIERQKLQRKRQELREKRIKTRNVQAGLISELRKLCLNASPPDYAAIFELYDEVERAHDELGVNEEDYDQEERRYDVLELQWTKNEGDIIGNLIEDIEELRIVPARENEVEPDPQPATSPDFLSTEPVFPVPDSPPSAATPEIQQELVSYSLKDAHPGTAETASEGHPGDQTDPEDESSAVPADPSAKHKHQLWEAVRPHMDILKDTRADDGRRASEPIRRQPRFLQPPNSKGPMRRPKSVSDLAGMEPRWQNVRSHVSQWIMDSLKGSLLQKALAKAQLRVDDLDEKDWWDQLKLVWSTDTANEEPAASEEEDYYVNVESEGVSVDWS